MSWTKDNPKFKKYLPMAEAKGISYGTYWRRCVTYGWDPERAATKKTETGRVPSPTSVRSMCRDAGINRRRYYDIKDELEEMGVGYTRQDIIDIAVNRKESRRGSER